MSILDLIDIDLTKNWKNASVIFFRDIFLSSIYSMLSRKNWLESIEQSAVK